MRPEIEQALKAFECDRPDVARELLEPLVAAGDMDAAATLGAGMTMYRATFLDGIALLRQAADAGVGIAAHNLGGYLRACGPGLEADPEEADRYMQIAVDTGVEGKITEDPYWWKNPTRPTSC